MATILFLNLLPIFSSVTGTFALRAPGVTGICFPLTRKVTEAMPGLPFRLTARRSGWAGLSTCLVLRTKLRAATLTTRLRTTWEIDRHRGVFAAARSPDVGGGGCGGPATPLGENVVKCDSVTDWPGWIVTDQLMPAPLSILLVHRTHWFVNGVCA